MKQVVHFKALKKLSLTVPATVDGKHRDMSLKVGDVGSVTGLEARAMEKDLDSLHASGHIIPCDADGTIYDDAIVEGFKPFIKKPHPEVANPKRSTDEDTADPSMHKDDSESDKLEADLGQDKEVPAGEQEHAPEASKAEDGHVPAVDPSSEKENKEEGTPTEDKEESAADEAASEVQA